MGACQGMGRGGETFKGELVPALTSLVSSCVRFSIRLCKAQACEPASRHTSQHHLFRHLSP